MNLGVLVIGNDNLINANKFDTATLLKMLTKKGYDVNICVEIIKRDDVSDTINFIKKNNDAIIICGNIDFFYDAISTSFEIDNNLSILNIDEISYALMPTFDNDFVNDKIIPMLNSKCKTFYTTVIFKTFNKTEAELKDLLKDYIKNRNRILFSFYPSLLECEVNIRYSSKMSKNNVDEVITNVAKILADCTYAIKDVSLLEQVVDLLKIRGKKICVAESFTGGAIASALTSIAGASEYFYEGIVSYSNLSKQDRLDVEPAIIKQFGAVSIETAYEMAANILMHNKCDIVLATTGNAGPTSEKDGQVGVCFIAVGDSGGIHIYQYNFKGDRQSVIQSGMKTALFKLYKKLKQNEFEDILNENYIK